MSFKDLLVVVDHGRNCPARIDLATRLGRDFAAQLTGLYVNTIASMQPVVLSEFPLEVREVHTRAMREAAEKAKALFDAGVERAGFGFPTEWREGEGDAAEVA